MIIVNKTKAKIQSHHRRGDFLNPGRNTLDDASITRSERAYIDALVKAKIAEIEVEAPELPPDPVPTPPPDAPPTPLALTTTATPPTDQNSKRRPRKPQE